MHSETAIARRDRGPLRAGQKGPNHVSIRGYCPPGILDKLTICPALSTVTNASRRFSESPVRAKTSLKLPACCSPPSTAVNHGFKSCEVNPACPFQRRELVQRRFPAVLHARSRFPLYINTSTPFSRVNWISSATDVYRSLPDSNADDTGFASMEKLTPSGTCSARRVAGSLMYRWTSRVAA